MAKKKRVTKARAPAPKRDSVSGEAISRQTLPEPRFRTIIDRLNLKSVRLLETNAKLSIHGGKVPSRIDIGVETSLGINAAESKLLGNVRVSLSPKDDSTADEPRSSLTILAVIQCVFHVDDAAAFASPSDADTEAMNQVVVFVAWPYLRQHIFSITSSMGIPPFTLPLMQFRFMRGSAATPEKK